MARTYGNTPVISKIQVGGQVKYLKDADVRAILDGIKDSYFTAFANEVDAANGLASKEYVDRIAELSFDVVKLAELPAANADNYAKYRNNIILVANEGAVAGDCIEYVIFRTNKGSEAEPNYEYKWEQIGSTKIDLTDYLTTAAKVAGVAFGDDKEITTQELKTALGGFSNAATASGIVGEQVFSGVQAAYTPEGTVAVELQQTATTVTSSGEYTPAGTVTVALSQTSTEMQSAGEYTPAGTVTVSLKQNTATVQSAGAYTPAGTVSVALEGNTIAAVKSVGVLPSFTYGAFSPAVLNDGFYTAGSDASLSAGAQAQFTQGAKATFTQGAKASLTDQVTSKFVKTAINARMATAEDKAKDANLDDECLIFYTATGDELADAVTNRGTFTANGDDSFTANGDDSFTPNTLQALTGGKAAVIDTTKFFGGSKDADQFNPGALMQTEDKTVTVASAGFAGAAATLSVSGVYNEAAVESASFAGAGATINVKGNYDKAGVQSAVFAGTGATIGVSGQYNAASVKAATFTGAQGVANVATFTVTAKTVTVSPDAAE